MMRLAYIGIMFLITTRSAHADSGFVASFAEHLLDSISEALFKQGKELAAAEYWTEACLKFEVSLRYNDRVLGAHLNLASCYEKVNRPGDAWLLYREAMTIAANRGDARGEFAKKHAEALEPQLARITIVPPVNPPAGLIVKWDNMELKTAQLSALLYLDTGEHEVVVSAPDFEAFTQTVTLTVDQNTRIEIPPLIATQAQPPEVPPLSPKIDDAPQQPPAAPQRDLRVQRDPPDLRYLAAARSDAEHMRAIGTALFTAGAAMATWGGLAMRFDASESNRFGKALYWSVTAAAVVGGISFSYVGLKRLHEAETRVAVSPLPNGAVALVSGRW